MGLAGALFAALAEAETLRIATYNPDLVRAGPGLMLQELVRGDGPQVHAVIKVLTALDADILLLTGVDYDARGEAAMALANLLSEAGLSYPYVLALRPNTGVATGLDLNGDGNVGGPQDAQAWGRFPGEGGMAILSRLPILGDEVRSLGDLLWADLPGGQQPLDTRPEVRALQRFSTAGHWLVPVQLPNERKLTVMAYYATPPVFDGADDVNGRRNHDETALWLRLMDGALVEPAPVPPFVIMGQSNLDPADGEGRRAAINTLLADSRLQDPQPHGSAMRSDNGQSGDPALDTALYDRIGGLRVEVVLPSTDLKVAASGVMWPPEDDVMAAPLAQASRHRPVWVDLDLP